MVSKSAISQSTPIQPVSACHASLLGRPFQLAIQDDVSLHALSSHSSERRPGELQSSYIPLSYPTPIGYQQDFEPPLQGIQSYASLERSSLQSPISMANEGLYSTFYSSVYQALPLNTPKTSEIAHSPQPPDEVTTQLTTPAPADAIVKRNNKTHDCDCCGKHFARPSGLKIHMNTHNNLKPFPCEFEGCTQTFAVRSNARRHLRTHGVDVAIRSRAEQPPPYVVGFNTPTIALPPAPGIIYEAPKKRYKVRWMSPSHMSRKYAPRAEGSDVDAGGEQVASDG